MKIRQFIEDNFLIDHHETSALVPYIFRPVQEKYYDILCRDYSEENNFEGAREIDLKARKEGFTSLWLAIHQAIAILSKDPVRFLEISYKDDATLQHYRRAKTFVASCAARRKVGDNLDEVKRLILDKGFLREVFLSEKEGEEFVLRHNGASFYVGTASSTTGERGGTVKGVLFSESAHYTDSGGRISANEIIEGTQNMVAVGTGIIVHESTANSFNHFYTRWEQAQKGEINYKPRFFGWREFYSPEQFEMIKAGFSDKRKIAQEYPETPEEAFLVSGDPYYNQDSLKYYMDNTQEPIRPEVIHDGSGKWRQFRPLEKGEFILVAGDCSQGGKDYNACQFMSKTRLDIPLVYHSRGVAAQMTRDIHPILERIFDVTGVKPIVALETANGGASEMDTLSVLNRQDKYDLFKMPAIGRTEAPESKILGYVTSGATRPVLVADGKDAVDGRVVRIYDKPTIRELYSFVTNRVGKPQAETGSHDDLVMSFNIVWQMYQVCQQVDYVDPAQQRLAREAVSSIMEQMRRR